MSERACSLHILCVSDSRYSIDKHVFNHWESHIINVYLVIQGLIAMYVEYHTKSRVESGGRVFKSRVIQNVFLNKHEFKDIHTLDFRLFH